MPFSFQTLEIPDVILIEARAFPDDRGFFMETYKQSDFEQHGIPWKFKQDNYSRSSGRGVLRGLHYQKDPKAQGKLVLAIRGEIFDVAVDIRKGSPTYGKWVGAELSDENHRMLYVPAGFAHGFVVLSSEADVMYRVTEEYAPEVDRGIRWNDPELGVAWPIDEPILSAKDQAAPFLKDADNNYEYTGDLS
jgi:dTDP-4-dehydrorhamnose 3,5-epimerase